MPVHVPPPVEPGQTLAVVSPARRVHDPDRLRVLTEPLEQAGYDILLPEANFRKHHQWAGTPEHRAAALEAAFSDRAVRGIICARGGYGAYQLLPHLDYELIAQNPKAFIGFSDITALHLAFYRHAGLMSYHGPVLATMDDPKQQDMIDVIRAPQSWHRDLGRHSDVDVLRSGTAQGPLIGGNLEILRSQLGTPTQPDLTGAVLFVEDTGTHKYIIDRTLDQLGRAGAWDAISGLIIGDFTDTKDTVGEGGFGLSLTEIFMRHVGGHDFPMAGGVPCGHGREMLTFPHGAEVAFHCAQGNVSLTFSP